MKLAWGAHLTEGEQQGLLACATAIAVDPSDLSACIAFESNWDPAALNEASGASGLIQFMPGPRGSAAQLGTTTEAIRAMSRLEQLGLVQRYFAPYVAKLHASGAPTLADVYMAILWPRGITLRGSDALFSKDDADSRAYFANKGLDVNQDGIVTKDEAAAYVKRKLIEGLQPGNVLELDDEAAAEQPQQETGMAGFGDAIASAAPVIGTAFGPIGTLLGGVAGALIKGFSAEGQQKIQKEIGRHTDQATAAKVAGSIDDAVQQFAMQLTGKSDPIEATVAARADPKVMAAIEKATLDDLDKLKPFLDDIHRMQQDEWRADEDAKTAAAGRAVTDNGFKIQWSTLNFTQKALAGSIMIVALLIAGQVLQRVPPERELLALLVMLVTGLFNTFRTQNDYGFGGSHGSDAKTAALSELAARRPKP